ncbi:MAG: Smr/MutS family protein [Prevotella sp.]|nr:Smr/MutS family protein [Prevotella sp.]
MEEKLGFTAIRTLLRGNCLCQLGWERVGEMTFMTDAAEINRQLSEVREFRKLREEAEELPLEFFFDVRQGVARLKLKGTHMEEQELFELMRCLQTIGSFKEVVNDSDDENENDKDDLSPQPSALSLNETSRYPTLWALAKDVFEYPDVSRRISQILDKYGHIKDSASSALFHIRGELKKAAGSVSQTLNSILRKAQQEGLIEKDVTPAMRDGRLVIPISPSMKRKISGIVHDESATGKTLFLEPTAVVEANNRVRELEAEERREIIRILCEVSDEIRPYADGILESMKFLGEIDFIQAKAQLAREFDAIEPEVLPYPHIDWVQARHPLLRNSLRRQNKEIVPLDIILRGEKSEVRGENKIPSGHILIISGPNAGGKSVCLKTVGLLQYMMQCGLSVPMRENSTMGVFNAIMIDIGDEQSIEDDLSTYSSHLLNMKKMIKAANDKVLLLIDEFGTGTEPQIGGAIAEAVLKQFWERKAWGVITTHYQNLKHFAEDHPGVINGAMLYDRHEMKALFQLQIGRPGSSFAIEIARKTGLPEEVISDASEIVGQDYIQSDKYLQDIVRDKRYWEQKRQTVHQREKDVEKTITRYESNIEEIDKERKAILRRAKEQAEELLREANRKIENTIREIREAAAEKERTRQLREELSDFRQEVREIDTTEKDAAIEKKMQQILARRERKAKRKQEKASGAKVQVSGQGQGQNQEPPKPQELSPIEKLMKKFNEGDTSFDVKVTQSSRIAAMADAERAKKSSMTRKVIEEHTRNFSHEIDVRGLRGDEALLKVQHFVDDAILIGVSQVRILHGKGNGILRSLIRDYLNALPNVLSCRDEHVQFGGAGITVVELG